jgi:hypothetical protein
MHIGKLDIHFIDQRMVLENKVGYDLNIYNSVTISTS